MEGYVQHQDDKAQLRNLPTLSYLWDLCSKIRIGAGFIAPVSSVFRVPVSLARSSSWVHLGATEPDALHPQIQTL